MKIKEENRYRGGSKKQGRGAKKKGNLLVLLTCKEDNALEEMNQSVTKPERSQLADGSYEEKLPPDNKWPKKNGKKVHNFKKWKYIDWHLPRGSLPMEW